MTRPKNQPPRTQPASPELRERTRVASVEAGGTNRLVDGTCPVSLATMLRVLAGQPVRLGQRIALEAWLDARQAGPKTASTAPASEQGATRAA